SYYCEASTCDNCWFAVAGEVTATLGREGRALKTENADLAGIVMKFTFVLSGQKIWGDALLKEREGSPTCQHLQHVMGLSLLHQEAPSQTDKNYWALVRRHISNPLKEAQEKHFLQHLQHLLRNILMKALNQMPLA
ncbi:hypothetical protein pdam_00011656, partial [Pocillopora damicornis]